ncbi:MAG TPA: hypothetical protein DDZ51_18035 [Planctomycetaceae bacterium]|nr:hypothetical protein [Planctomycetaceae bacterium]
MLITSLSASGQASSGRRTGPRFNSLAARRKRSLPLLNRRAGTRFCVWLIVDQRVPAPLAQSVCRHQIEKTVRKRLDDCVKQKYCGAIMLQLHFYCICGFRRR